jgi:hypothetical protein
MKGLRLKVLYIVLNGALLISLLFVGITSSQPPYDPWLDVTDDGYGGIDDIVGVAEHFGASGDPTKLCNITNWPISNTIDVWYNGYLTPLTSIASQYYATSGFGHLHILAHSAYLSEGESVVIKIQGRIFTDAGHSEWYLINTYTFTLNSTSATRAVTIPVPCETFRFLASTDAISECSIRLNFYLTWA